MSHIDSQTLADLTDSCDVKPRHLRHIDRCLTCRRSIAERGISNEWIATAIAAARSRFRFVAAAMLIATIAAITAIVIPLRGAASGFFAVFEPHSVRAVSLTLDDMRSLGRLPDFSAYATTRVLRSSRSAQFANAGAATSAAGFALRQPANVPLGVRAESYLVTSPSTQLITFENRPANARAAALPPDIAGSALRIDIGTTVVATYATQAGAADEARLEAAMHRLSASQKLGSRGPAPQSNPPLGYSPPVPSGAGHSDAPSGHVAVVGNTGHGWRVNVRSGELPLVIVQMPVPRVASTGVSVQRLASYMLAQPGIPPRVAAAFGALGDLSTTLPIPVPIDKAYTQPVSVDRVAGVGVGDDTGFGAAVIWQKNGMLYAVFAPRTAHDVLAIANSLR